MEIKNIVPTQEVHEYRLYFMKRKNHITSKRSSIFSSNTILSFSLKKYQSNFILAAAIFSALCSFPSEEGAWLVIANRPKGNMTKSNCNNITVQHKIHCYRYSNEARRTESGCIYIHVYLETYTRTHMNGFWRARERKKYLHSTCITKIYQHAVFIRLLNTLRGQHQYGRYCNEFPCSKISSCKESST